MTDKASQQVSFLERWSRRKRGLEDERDDPVVDVAEDGTHARDASEASDPAKTAAGEEQTPGQGEDAAPLKDFAEFDFEKLDYESDYTQFMGKDVTSDARHKALRKLWISNPVLANMDGLDDYCEDYTDAAVCVPKGMLKTAYQYGRGFLDDDEVAEWEALGREPEAVAEAASDEEAVAVSEDAEGNAEADSAEVAAAEATGAHEETADASSGAGAACGAAVKQEEAQMLAEFDEEKSSQQTKAKS